MPRATARRHALMLMLILWLPLSLITLPWSLPRLRRLAGQLPELLRCRCLRYATYADADEPLITPRLRYALILLIRRLHTLADDDVITLMPPRDAPCFACCHTPAAAAITASHFASISPRRRLL